MIKFTPKPMVPAKPVLPGAPAANRFEDIRRAAAERHKKSDTDGTRRRHRQTVEDNRLI